MYERSKTPTTPSGIFIRNRNNVQSVRSRRNRKLDSNDNEIDDIKRSNYHLRRSRYSSEFDSSTNLQSKSEEILLSSEHKNYRRERAYSNDWDKRNAQRSRKNSYEEEDEDFDDDLDEFRPVSRRDFQRKSEVFSSHRKSSRMIRTGPMETLDRRISASTDNLDTLKRDHHKKTKDRVWNEPILQRPRSVSSRKVDHSKIEENDDVTFRINGEKMSKNRYFFGNHELKSALKNPNGGGGKSSAKNVNNNKNTESTSNKKNGRKTTALDIFLEDKGPYSRKLYGPPPASASSNHSSSAILSSDNSNGEVSNRKRARSQEALLQSTEVSQIAKILV